MIITTTPTVEGHPAMEYKGIVATGVVLGANVFVSLWMQFKTVLGLRSQSFESVFAAARTKVLERLEKQARQRGANAVVGVRIGASTIFGYVVVCSASGTAVVIKETN